MSAFGKHGARCDWCGKFTNAFNKEYLRPDGITAGYILMELDGDGIDRGWDKCDECREGKCTSCGDKGPHVRISPATPGPDGWGWRCKACNYRWYLRLPADAEVTR